MRAFFHWGQRHRLLVPPSMLSVLRKDVSEVHCLDCWGASCIGLVTDPLLSDVGRQEQVLCQHCLLLMKDYEQANTEHISARLSMCLWVSSCLWRYLWRLQPQEFVTAGLFVNFRRYNRGQTNCMQSRVHSDTIHNTEKSLPAHKGSKGISKLWNCGGNIQTLQA